MATGDLISLQEFKEWIGLSQAESEDTDRLYQRIISGVSQWVTGYCCRDSFFLNWRTEFLSGANRPRLWLRNAPIQDVDFVRYGTTDALTVRYTGAAHHATVEVEDRTSIKLITATSGTRTVQATLLFSTYGTLATLVAAINAASGWSASQVATDANHLESINLLPFQGGNAVSEDLYVQTPDEPVDGYWVDPTEGYLELQHGAWPVGRRNIIVRACCGYGSTAGTENKDALPEDLKTAGKELCKLRYSGRNLDTGMESERLEGYSYRRAVSPTQVNAIGIPHDIARMLARYRRVTLN